MSAEISHLPIRGHMPSVDRPQRLKVLYTMVGNAAHCFELQSNISDRVLNTKCTGVATIRVQGAARFKN